MKLLWKDLFRTIKQSLGRFIAIAGIIALGVGFYGGLRMSCNDMKIVSSEYYSNTNLMDIRIVSTLGLSDENIDALKNIDCVDGIMPAYETDILANWNDTQSTIRLHSLNESAYNSTNINNEKIESEDNNYINRPILLDGEWPKNSDECVISLKASKVNQQNIGDEIDIKECSQDIEKTISVRKLKIVGFVKSSYYICTNKMGSSTLGWGNIDQYAYAPRSTFASDLPYTEAFLTIKGAKAHYYNSQEYQDIIDNAMNQIYEIAPEQSHIRTSDVKAEANKLIDEGQVEYDANKAKADNEFAANEEKLNKAKKDIDNGRKYIEQMQKQLDQGYAEFNTNKAQALQKIADAKNQIKQIEDLVTPTIKNYETNKNKILKSYNICLNGHEKALLELPKIISELDNTQIICEKTLDIAEKYIPDQQLKDQVKAAISLRQGAAKAFQAQSKSFLKEIENAPESKRAEVYALGLQGFKISYGLFDLTNLACDQIVLQLKDKIDAAYQEISSQEQIATQQLSEAELKLNNAKSQLQAAKNKLEVGNKEYIEGLDKFNAAKNDALAALNEAQIKINDSKAEVDKIESAEFLIMDRSKNYGCESMVNDADRIDGISQVFPFIFFVVAALVALTSMTRMVEEERILIGTYKAIGISPKLITLRYIAYILIAGFAGSIIGLIIIPQILPYIILTAYTVIYDHPFNLLMPFDWGLALLSVAMGVGIALLATIAACANSLRQVPAQLMLPKAPKAGKKILLEKIGFFWKSLSFNWKIALRNMFLYKKRLIMTVVGIAGCTALLLTGFGLSDSINDIIDLQYDRLMYDNFAANFKGEASAQNYDEIDKILSKYNIEDNYCYTHEEKVIAQPKGHPDCLVGLIVPQDIKKFKNLRVVQDRKTQQEISIEDGSIYINEKLASLMNVSIGDNLQVFEEDKIGNAGAKSYNLRIGGIYENYVGHNIYMTQKTFEDNFSKKTSINSLLLRYKSDSNSQDEFSEEMYSINGIKTVTYTDKAKDTYRTMLKSVDMVVVVLIVFAAILAFVVLFNLTNINICERIREIATLKVLGGRRAEITMYIHRETLILSLIGALVGIALGFIMENFVIISAEVDYVMFGRQIYLPSILYSVLITIAFTLIVVVLTIKKIHNISMVESLKSNE